MLSLIFTLLVIALIIWGVAWYFTGREEGPLKTGIDVEKNETQPNDQKTNLQLKGNELKSSRRRRIKERKEKEERERKKREESKNKKDQLKEEEDNLKGTESEIGLEEDGEESNEPQLKERNKEQPRFEMKRKKEQPRFELQEDEDK